MCVILHAALLNDWFKNMSQYDIGDGWSLRMQCITYGFYFLKRSFCFLYSLLT